MRHGKIILLIGFLISLFAALAGATPLATSGDAPSREYQVKAAMIVNFVQFVEWPADAFSSERPALVVAVVGANPFGDVLEQIAQGKTVAGRAIVVRYFSSADRIEPCHALFVPPSQDADVGRIMQKIGGQPVLSVGESEAFSSARGIIRFYTEDNKVRFEINPNAAEKAGITISSKLLKLARVSSR